MYRLWKMIILFHFCINSVVCVDTLLEFLTQNIDHNSINELDINNLNISELDFEKYEEEFKTGEKDEDKYLNENEIIMKYGYSVEEHNVVTSDGRALKLIRIPGNGPPVFLMHGLMCSSVDWLTGSPDTNIPFYLADRNFDVWMSSERGSKDLKENENIPKKNFWDFSWHEIGLYDLPSMIDHVLNKTNQKSLIYIGHSQGTTVFYVMCSLRPEYNDKITLMISLSPIAWFSHMKSPVLHLLSPIAEELYNFSVSTGVYDLFEGGTLLQFFHNKLCGNVIIVEIVCKNILYLFAGVGSQTTVRRLPVIFNHFPSPASVKQIVHYLQLVKSGKFQQFDYGSQNILVYGSPEPPSYAIENITVPVAIFLSDGDWLSSKSDLEILVSKLPNLVEYYEIPDKMYNHVDYLYADVNKSTLLPRILALLKKYS